MKYARNRFFQVEIIVIGIDGKRYRIAVPGELRRERVYARAEIQHVFLGFFLLPLSGPPMNNPFWKIRQPSKILYFYPLLGLEVINAFAGGCHDAKKKVYISYMFYFDSSG